MSRLPTHELAVRVYYEDTDAAGIVYHSNYLVFAERGRTEFLRSRGLDHGTLREAHGLVFAVARCAMGFKAPARLDDLLAVHTELREVVAARLEFAQAVRRGAATLCELEVTIVALAAGSLRPRRLPAALGERLFSP